MLITLKQQGFFPLSESQPHTWVDNMVGEPTWYTHKNFLLCINVVDLSMILSAESVVTQYEDLIFRAQARCSNWLLSCVWRPDVQILAWKFDQKRPPLKILMPACHQAHNWTRARDFTGYKCLCSKCLRPVQDTIDDLQSLDAASTVNHKGYPSCRGFMQSCLGQPAKTCNAEKYSGSNLHLVVPHWTTVELLPTVVDPHNPLQSSSRRTVSSCQKLHCAIFLVIVSLFFRVTLCVMRSPEPLATGFSPTIALDVCGIVLIGLVVWHTVVLRVCRHSIAVISFMQLQVRPLSIIVIVRELFTSFNITHRKHSDVREPLVCGLYINSIDFQVRITAASQTATLETSV